MGLLCRMVGFVWSWLRWMLELVKDLASKSRSLLEVQSLIEIRIMALKTRLRLLLRLVGVLGAARYLVLLLLLPSLVHLLV